MPNIIKGFITFYANALWARPRDMSVCWGSTPMQKRTGKLTVLVTSVNHRSYLGCQLFFHQTIFQGYMRRNNYSFMAMPLKSMHRINSLITLFYHKNNIAAYACLPVLKWYLFGVKRTRTAPMQASHKVRKECMTGPKSDFINGQVK